MFVFFFFMIFYITFYSYKYRLYLRIPMIPRNLLFYNVLKSTKIFSFAELLFLCKTYYI